MKTIIWLLIVIGWSVLQARRKAMREQRKMQAMRAAAKPEPQAAEPQRVPIAEGNKSYETYKTYDPSDDRDIPKEVLALQEYAKKRREERQTASQDELVDEIVQPVAAGAYDIEPETKPKIVFDRDSLRTFFVMREVLGPPRFRKHFRPRMKAQE